MMLYLIDPKDKTDIYLKMKEAVENKDRLYSKGILFYEYVKNNFSIEIFNNKCKEIFNEILQDRCDK